MYEMMYKRKAQLEDLQDMYKSRYNETGDEECLTLMAEVYEELRELEDEIKLVEEN